MSYVLPGDLREFFRPRRVKSETNLQFPDVSTNHRRRFDSANHLRTLLYFHRLDDFPAISLRLLAFEYFVSRLNYVLLHQFVTLWMRQPKFQKRRSFEGY